LSSVNLPIALIDVLNNSSLFFHANFHNSIKSLNFLLSFLISSSILTIHSSNDLYKFELLKSPRFIILYNIHGHFSRFFSAMLIQYLNNSHECFHAFFHAFTNSFHFSGFFSTKFPISGIQLLNRFKEFSHANFHNSIKSSHFSGFFSIKFLLFFNDVLNKKLMFFHVCSHSSIKSYHIHGHFSGFFIIKFLIIGIQ
jgi:hypothetical protein